MSTRKTFVRLLMGTALVSSLLAASGCSSAKKKAVELLEKENYEDAAAQLEKLTLQDPSDTELPSLLQQARSGAIDKRLIAVRMDRMSGNSEGALEKLRNTIHQQQTWKLSLNSKMAFTAGEESELAWPFYENSLVSALNSGHPLRADWRIKKYQFIFSAKPTWTHRLQDLNQQTQKLGRIYCEKEAATSSELLPWQGEFVGRICSHFGADEHVFKRTSLSRELATSSLFRSLNIQATLQGTSERELQTIRQAFVSAFENSPYFDGSAQKYLRFELNGNLQNTIARESVQLSHPYTEEETYEDFVSVAKKRSVPFSALENNSHPVTQYREETYLTQEKVKRTRSVARIYHFPATRIDQKLELTLESSADIGTRVLRFPFTRAATQSGNEHSLNLPKIGLKPMRVALFDTWVFLNELRPTVSQQLTEAFYSHWKTSFCTPSAPLASENQAGFEKVNATQASGERVQLCLRGILPHEQAPSFAEDWYRNQIDLSVSDARELLGLSRP